MNTTLTRAGSRSHRFFFEARRVAEEVDGSTQYIGTKKGRYFRTMGMQFETTGSLEFEPGAYEGHLLKIEKRSKIFTTKNENDEEVREDRSFLIWYFAIDEEGYEDVTLTAISSTSFGSKAKARRWANAILRRKLADGEKFGEDDLKNKPVMLNIDNEETERGTFARIVDLTQVRSPKGAPKKKEEPKGQERELTESDLEDLNEALGDAA